MNISVAEQYKFIGLQMAAEANLVDPDGLPFSGAVLISALVRGNGHSSVFTRTEAEHFAEHWRVVAQSEESGTGFCGTLFECIQSDPTTGTVAGERVISFRSTEFIDDAVRDNEATNQHEIRATGWAWGQLRDMEQWYAQLRADPKSFDSQDFSVTGYSLGGHLASAFNLLHPNQAKQVVTFNGAGVGNLEQGVPAQELARFTEMTGTGGVQLIEQAIGNSIIIGWYRTATAIG